MDVVELDVQTREAGEKAKSLLKNDQIPAEYYGRGVENLSMKMDYQTFRRAFRKAGSNTVIELNVDGKDKRNVLVHSIQRHPVTDLFTHVDFINVRMDEKVHTRVPLEFTGTSAAVKDESGTLVTHMTEIEIECLPKDLVHTIEVSIDPLVDFHSSIHVSDVKVPDTITVLSSPEELVASVSAPRAEEEPVAAEGGEESAEGASEEGAAEGGEEAASE